jgi:protoporphyrinogen oxidase
VRDGFTWDDGPHISFTGNEYVRELFAAAVGGAHEECTINPSNYFHGHWIDHPAQTHLYQVPEPLRTECLESFLASRDLGGTPANYREWLHQSMGPVFADTFPAAYTRKYWTTDPGNLDTDWIGVRVLKPEVEDVVNGAEGPLPQSTYYVAGRDARYPTRGGFMAYTHRMAEGAAIRYRARLERIDFGRRSMSFSDGTTTSYDGLVSTIPLPSLIAASTDAPDTVREAASMLRCTNFLRVDVAAAHPTRRDELWMYVYDEDKLSVRISITENFSPNNAPRGKSGIQVEVYGSEYRPVPTDHTAVRSRVVAELVEMGLVDGPDAVESTQVTFVPQGNPIFDLDRRAAMEEIHRFLDRIGVLLAGRYAEWKYLMTDGCVISARRAATALSGRTAELDDAGSAISSQG